MKKDEPFIDNRNINSFQNEDIWSLIKNQFKEKERYSEMEKDNLEDTQKYD